MEKNETKLLIQVATNVENIKESLTEHIRENANIYAKMDDKLLILNNNYSALSTAHYENARKLVTVENKVDKLWSTVDQMRVDEAKIIEMKEEIKQLKVVVEGLKGGEKDIRAIAKFLAWAAGVGITFVGLAWGIIQWINTYIIFSFKK